VKSRVVLSALVVIGSLALSAPAAHAGSGGTPSPLTSFFVCHGINGKDVGGDAYDLYNDPFGPIRLGIRIGSGVLACAQAKLWPAGAPPVPETEVPPVPDGVSHEQLKCYTISASRQPPSPPGGTPTRYGATDAFVEESVQASDRLFVCAPATFLLSP
jgi:hypothetical protein